jgi:hypothetical protein
MKPEPPGTSTRMPQVYSARYFPNDAAADLVVALAFTCRFAM